MNAEIREWANRYEALKEQKTMIEKESANLLKNMETCRDKDCRAI